MFLGQKLRQCGSRELDLVDQLCRRSRLSAARIDTNLGIANSQSTTPEQSDKRNTCTKIATDWTNATRHRDDMLLRELSVGSVASGVSVTREVNVRHH